MNAEPKKYKQIIKNKQTKIVMKLKLETFVSAIASSFSLNIPGKEDVIRDNATNDQAPANVEDIEYIPTVADVVKKPSIIIDNLLYIVTDMDETTKVEPALSKYFWYLILARDETLFNCKPSLLKITTLMTSGIKVARTIGIANNFGLQSKYATAHRKTKDTTNPARFISVFTFDFRTESK